MSTGVPALVLESLDVILKQQKLPAISEIGLDAPLYTSLDSLAVLDVILELEDRLQKSEGRYVQIADEQTFDREKTPFKTANLLVDFVVNKVKG